MNIVLQTSERTLVSMSSEELAAIANALNEVCNGIAISESDFQTRLGSSREFLRATHTTLIGKASRQSYEAVDVWADQSSVMVRSITAFGDPVEMGETEAAEVLVRLQRAISEAS